MTAAAWECWDFEMVRGGLVRLFYRLPSGKLEPVVWCLRCQIRSKA